MHVTLHLTNRCNMACKILLCGAKNRGYVRLDCARGCGHGGAERPEAAALIFFGGEPLLRKELIQETIDYAQWVQAQGNVRFHYKVTTNGLLLDEAFFALLPRPRAVHRPFARRHTGGT